MTIYSHPRNCDSLRAGASASAKAAGASASQSQEAHRSDTSSASWGGIYSSVSGVLTETDDELDTDDGSFVSTLTLNLPVLTTNTVTTTYSGANHDHAVDNFTAGGAAPDDDVNYNDDDRSKDEQIDDESYSLPVGGGTVAVTDNTDDTQKATDTDVGQDDQGTGGETDVGTATDTDTDTAKQTTSYQQNTPPTTENDSGTVGDVYDDRVIDNYNAAGGGETDDDTFHAEDRPYANHNDQTTYVAPGDPGTNSGTSDVGSGSGDDVDDGSADETNGVLTGETDNFNDNGQSQDTLTNYAKSDQPPVALPDAAVPLLNGPPQKTLTSLFPVPAGMFSVPGYAGQTLTVSGSYSGPSGSGNISDVQTASDLGQDTDTDGGTLVGGVTTDEYNDQTGDTAKSGEQFSYQVTNTGEVDAINSGTYNSTNTMITTGDVSGGYTTLPVVASAWRPAEMEVFSRPSRHDAPLESALRPHRRRAPLKVDACLRVAAFSD